MLRSAVGDAWIPGAAISVNANSWMNVWMHESGGAASIGTLLCRCCSRQNWTDAQESVQMRRLTRTRILRRYIVLGWVDGGSCAVAVWSAGGSGAPLARSSRLFGAKGSSSGILLRLLSRFLWVHHYRPVHRRVQDGLTQVQPLLLVHAWSNSEYGLLLLLRLVRVHHKRAGLREGWRFADPRLVALVGLRHHWFELAGGARREVEALPDSRVLKHYQRPLGRQLDFSGARLALRWENVNSFQRNNYWLPIFLQKYKNYSPKSSSNESWGRKRRYRIYCTGNRWKAFHCCAAAGAVSSGRVGWTSAEQKTFKILNSWGSTWCTVHVQKWEMWIKFSYLWTFVTAVGLVVGVQSLVSLQVAEGVNCYFWQCYWSTSLLFMILKRVILKMVFTWSRRTSCHNRHSCGVSPQYAQAGAGGGQLLKMVFESFLLNGINNTGNKIDFCVSALNISGWTPHKSIVKQF